MSGVTRQSYSPEIRIIRLMCTGRVDLSFILRALINGADGARFTSEVLRALENPLNLLSLA